MWRARKASTSASAAAPSTRDTSREDAFVQWFQGQNSNDAPTYRFFARDLYYTLYGPEEAVPFAQRFGLTADVKQLHTSHGSYPYVHVRGKIFRQVAGELLSSGTCIEIYCTGEGASSSGSSGSGTGSSSTPTPGGWRLAQRATPSDPSALADLLVSTGGGAAGSGGFDDTGCICAISRAPVRGDDCLASSSSSSSGGSGSAGGSGGKGAGTELVRCGVAAVNTIHKVIYLSEFVVQAGGAGAGAGVGADEEDASGAASAAASVAAAAASGHAQSEWVAIHTALTQLNAKEVLLPLLGGSAGSRGKAAPAAAAEAEEEDGATAAVVGAWAAARAAAAASGCRITAAPASQWNTAHGLTALLHTVTPPSASASSSSSSSSASAETAETGAGTAGALPLPLETATTLHLALSALAALHTHLRSCSTAPGSAPDPRGYALCGYDPHASLRLDAFALSALRIFPPPTASTTATAIQAGSAGADGRGVDARSAGGRGGRGVDRSSSLFAYLNRCVSPMGSRLLRLWLRQPITAPTAISARHDVVELLAGNSSLRGTLRGDIRQLISAKGGSSGSGSGGGGGGGKADVGWLARRLPLGYPHVGLRDLVRAYRFAVGLEALVSHLSTALGVSIASEGTAGGDADAEDDTQGSGEPAAKRTRVDDSTAATTTEAVQPSLLVQQLRQLQRYSSSLSRLCDLCQDCIDLPLLSSKGRYHVSPEYHPQLGALKRDIEAAEADVEAAAGVLIACVAKAAGSGNGSSGSSKAGGGSGKAAERVKVQWWHPTWGIHCRIPPTHQQTFRAAATAAAGAGAHALLELGIRTDGIHFTSPALKAAAAEYRGATAAYKEAQAVLEGKIMAVAATYAPVLHAACEAVAVLDVLAAFAETAVNASGVGPHCRPRLVVPAPGQQQGQAQAVMRIRGLRHPLVEEALAFSSSSSSSAAATAFSTGFVPNDVTLGCGLPTRSDADADAPDGTVAFTPVLALVTGPNTGGKSTYIRSVALAVVLCQIGAFIPAASAHMPIFDAVLTRVGAGDDPLRGVSSFYGEMLQTASLLRSVSVSVTPRSLVVVDELGRGTDAREGRALAQAVAEHLAARVGCASLMATHFHELASLEATCTATAGCSSSSSSSRQGAVQLVANYHMASVLTAPTSATTASAATSASAAASGSATTATATAAATGTASRGGSGGGEAVVMLYEVRPGPTAASFGLAVAAACGMPAELLADAHALLAGGEIGAGDGAGGE